MTDVIEALMTTVDDALGADVMSAADALDAYQELEAHCRMMAQALRADLDRVR